MTILEKAYALRQKTALASNLDYAIEVAWGDENKDEAIARMRSLADSVIQNLTSPRFERLDYDVRQATYTRYDNQLEEELRKFPDYAVEKQEGNARRL